MVLSFSQMDMHQNPKNQNDLKQKLYGYAMMKLHIKNINLG